MPFLGLPLHNRTLWDVSSDLTIAKCDGAGKPESGTHKKHLMVIS